MRSRVRGEKSFKELLQEVKADTLESHAHQDIPFEQLVDHLEVERDINRNPVFQVRFVVHDQIDVLLQLDPIKLTYMQSEAEQSKFDLLFRVFSSVKDPFGISIEYMKDLYEERTV